MRWEQVADNNNYALANELFAAVEEQLEQSVHKEQALRPAESEARRTNSLWRRWEHL